MTIKKKFFVFIILVLLVIFFVFWGKEIFIFYAYTDKNERDIFYNYNSIGNNYDCYSSLTYEVENSDFGKSIKFRFTGMDTICRIDSKEDTTILIKYNYEIFHGRFKVVLIDANNNIINLIEQSNVFNIFKRNKSNEIAVTLKKGESRIKIIGKDANGILDFKVDYNELVTLYINDKEGMWLWFPMKMIVSYRTKKRKYNNFFK